MTDLAMTVGGAAARVAAELGRGQVPIDAHGRGVRPDLTFGGHKRSGLRVENVYG
ncbi:hypothetical protein AB0392_56810 [Nonomuraea angiospora]|uniref:hypothetical protein n=1 Tax=Nonomuraea angiospora TaxID=46172 RepID=UPI00344E1825